MSNSSKIVLAFLSGCILALMFTLSAVAIAAPDPGSPDDPLVTRSYVDRLISDLAAVSHGTLSAQQMESIVNAVVDRIVLQGRGACDKFQPIHMTAGQLLIGEEGTELILRSGSATVHTGGPDGLANVTFGIDVVHGEQISRNHLLIVPRSDGRGILATTGIYVMIKGEFTIY